ncbi:hypothetical protein B0H14DRAFT_3655747 [Mycena olivaceomarginata]|nr:hypothetical protein B0H14DRAFT_3655747 [Mycena olivaceomarginata]
MAEAKASDDCSRREVLAELFKRKKDDAVSVVSRATSAGRSQFKVVASKRESLLPNSGHPTGWVNRADDAKAAETSNEWCSDVFDIKSSTAAPATGAAAESAPPTSTAQPAAALNTVNANRAHGATAAA